jgi:hypothetical protein
MIASRNSMSQFAFAAWVDNLINAAIMEGASSFAALLRRLPGVYPTEVLTSLDRLVTFKTIDVAVAASIRRQAATNGLALVEGRSLLPLPHPLDYEWRFTPDAARWLLNRAADLTDMGGDKRVRHGRARGCADELLQRTLDRRLVLHSLGEAASSDTQFMR